MEFVSPIITSVVQSVMVPVKEHLGFFVYSTKYVKKMDVRVKQLNDTAQEVQARLTAAVENTEVVPGTVMPWLEDVKSLNVRSNMIEAIGCFNVTKRYKAGKQSYNILEEIRDLENRESKIVFTHAQKPLAEVGCTSTATSTFTSVTQSNFESRDLTFKSALQALQSNNESQKMIALCGMGGVGKTTMMEQLKNVVEDSNMFDSVVKVVIGENIDVISLQQAIAQYIGSALTESTKDARADRLRKIFDAKSQQGQKKILVIMDDLWNEVNLNDVGLSPLPHGFKMLFTSRFESVCTQMGVRSHSIFRIGVLSKTEAETLFTRTVGPCPSDADDVELQRIGKDIVMRCGGLPIAIVTIARSLSGNIKEAWQKALWRLEKDDLKDLERITHKIFEMSYENLKEEEDKAIFILSGLFPDDFDIRIEDLLRYGWGLNLFKDAKTLAIARRNTKISVNNLIRANLLTESDVNGCVRMHDLIRAFVLTNFSEVKQASIVYRENMSVHTLKNDAKNSCERVLLKCTNVCEVPIDINYSNLSLLILMDGYKLKFLEHIHQRMEKLKVMSYQTLSIPLLPVMFVHSTKLRTLCLCSCSLINSDISFLGNICNLEILSLVGCKIRRLPSMIGRLKKLRLLDLTRCIDLHIDDGVIPNLVSLEELYLRAFKGRHVKFTHANCVELRKLTQQLSTLELEFFAPGNPCIWTQSNKNQLKNISFKNLERFSISIGCELEVEQCENQLFKNTLYLAADCNELQEWNINDLIEKTEVLKLQVKDMNNFEDISMQHTFSQLEVFNVSKCVNLTCLFTAVMASSLKKLERLVISECPVLETLVSENSEVGVITFPKLNFISLKGLPKMVSLFDGVINLPELMELRLYGLPNFTSIYSDNNKNTSTMRTLLNMKVMVPRLKKLDIYMMENLEQIWPCQFSTGEKNDVSMLRQIGVRECHNLINLFPNNPLPLLNHLEELVVVECGSIEVLFNINFESISGMCEHYSKLRSIKVAYLKNLKELWRVSYANNLDINVNGFKGVQSIEIERCKAFTSIFTPTTLNFDLSALTTYKTLDSGCEFEESDRKNNMTMERDEEINVTYPSYLLHTCHHLQHLVLNDDKRVERAVFEMDSRTPLLLPYLEVVELFGLNEMSHVWKCSRNKFSHQPSQFPFQNLTQVSLWRCPKITYLFSPLMVKYLSKLESVEIGMCDGIEKVFSSRDDENIPNTVHGQSQSAQVSDACWSLCQYPKYINIFKCDALSILIPWYVVGHMQKIEKLRIASCKTLTKVFESESINNVDEASTLGTTLTSPKHKNITTLHVPQLSHLKSLFILYCDFIPYIFTFSALESIKQLKELEVKRCNKIQVIVKEENGTSSKDVVFPRLERLELHRLPSLKGFFLGMNDFRWPLLDNVMISDCPQLMIFTPGHSKTPKLKNIRTSLGKHSIECGLNFPGTINQQTSTSPSASSCPTISKGMLWSFHNLIEVDIPDHRYAGRTFIIPSNVLLHLEKLEKIHLCGSCIEEVFEVVALEGKESQTVVKIPNLKQVSLECIIDLKYLWKSNKQMVLEFPKLTNLFISGSNSLEHVFTSSMVGSLVQLQDLEISWCGNIEVIVKEEEEDGESCDGKVNEIMLPRLKSLKLIGLSSLKGFCLGKEAFSVPVLDTLEIYRCRAITVFTKGNLATPDLKIIDIDCEKHYVQEDLNFFIKTKQEEGLFFMD